MLEGNLDSKILVVSDHLRVIEKAEGKILSGQRRQVLETNFSQNGLTPSDYALTVVYPFRPTNENIATVCESDKRNALLKLKETILKSKANVIVALGELPLNVLTGHSTIGKWHLSVLKARAEYGALKVIPLLSPNHVLRSYRDSIYLGYGAQRILDEATSKKLTVPDRKFLLGPSLEVTLAFLERCKQAKVLGIDVETGRGQINTMGIAISPTEAIAIRVLPDSYGPKNYRLLWSKIQEVMESDVPKVGQNVLYDTLCLSQYGIFVRNIVHDTMWCMKFLHPELNMGLDNVGRFYTPFPYWKDDGKNWNNIRDWTKHLEYNCKDTTGTLWAYYEQVKDLEERRLTALFSNFVMKFFPPIREMCSRGLPLSLIVKNNMQRKAQGEADILRKEISETFLERVGYDVNPRSPVQLKKALTELGIKIPFVKGKQSTDKKALSKLAKKYKKEPVLGHLIKLSKKNKMLSSYLNFGYSPDNRVRYTLNGCGTETGRWSGKLFIDGTGFNPQTVPKFARKMFAAEEGKLLMEIDLAQAESRYVAWEAPEPTLMELITNGRDIHNFVAARIFNVAEHDVTKEQRQLGKKSGHSANYGVGPRTFADACFVEQGIQISEREAKRIIDGYYSVFPGIKRRQLNIQAQIRRSKKLTTALGRERYFYDRICDSLFREAYAYAPQSVIPDITNHLMLFLYDLPYVEFLLQVHDSLLLQVPIDKVREVISLAKNLDSWHPKISLPGGDLQIPVDVQVGKSWGTLETL